MLKIATINCQGQTRLTLAKQLQIEQFVKQNNIDVLFCQETAIAEDTFKNCNNLINGYNIIFNNATNDYGTAIMVRNSMEISNTAMDTQGRIIRLDSGATTLVNVYPKSGTDAESRKEREEMFASTLPNMLLNRKQNVIIGGDWNAIILATDATKYPEVKMSPTLKRLIAMLQVKDCQRVVGGRQRLYSRYYIKDSTQEATRIDRIYVSDDMFVENSEYTPLAFSDHWGQIVKIMVDDMSIIKAPPVKSDFKIKPTIVDDEEFQQEIRENMFQWEEVRAKYNYNILDWWENLVKPGIRLIAIEHTKRQNKEKQGKYNLLLLAQMHYAKQVRDNTPNALMKLEEIKALLVAHYEQEADTMKILINAKEYEDAETVSLYHHEIHKKRIVKSTILEIEEAKELYVGHKEVSKVITDSVAKLLENKFIPSSQAQKELLQELKVCFTEEDNIMLEKCPDREEILKVLRASNHHSAPGTDSITNYFYLKMFDCIGDSLTQVIQTIFMGENPTKSQRTCKMIFLNKPHKVESKLLKDKRKISLLNTDFKIISGIENSRHQTLLDRTVSSNQYALGKSKNISHAITLALDAIWAANRTQQQAAIADLDFESAFDLLCMEWVLKVLEKKGMNEKNVARIKRYYQDSTTIPIINNNRSRGINNLRMTLRQGDGPSSAWYGYAIDPLLNYLESRLKGITLQELTPIGPKRPGKKDQMEKIVSKYILMGYVDDLKPAITSLEEFYIVEKAVELYESSSGCRLHKDIKSQKCKVMPMGSWKTLKQEDIPIKYIARSEFLDMLGVQLYNSYRKSKQENCETMLSKVRKKINSWKAGKFMPLCDRPRSINIYAYANLWYRTSVIDLRKSDIKEILSLSKSYIYQDMFIKPEEMSLYRKEQEGGMGLEHVEIKARAVKIKNFIQMAANKEYQTNSIAKSVYEYYVEGNGVKKVALPPYYTQDMLEQIKEAKNEGIEIRDLSGKDWQKRLLNREMFEDYNEDLEQWEPKLTKIEYILPQINHIRAYGNIMNKVHSARVKSSLFKMKNNLFPTQERMFKCRQVDSNRCLYCPRVEDLAHLLICGYTPYRPILQKLITMIRTINPDISLEMIVQFDVNMDEKNLLTIGAIIATVFECIMEVKRKKMLFEINQMRKALKNVQNLFQYTKRQEHYMEKYVSYLIN